MVSIIKKSGEKTAYSLKKLKTSLSHSGAEEHLVEEIANKVVIESHDGISTEEIYNRVLPY